MTKDALGKLFDHMAWADGEVLEALSATAPEPLALETRLEDILVHVARHGSYHRGQIAAQLRARR